MPTAYHNIAGKQGATLTRQITVAESDGVTPFDFTGWTLRGQLREIVTDEKVADFTVTSSSAGVVDCELSATDTSALTPATDWNYYYDIEAEAAGVVHCLAEGKAKFAKNATT